MKEIYTMTQKEIKKLEIVQKMAEKHMKQQVAADSLGISVRQAQRLLKNYRQSGVDGITSKKRGKPSNNRLSKATKEMAIYLIRKNYHDFGPTLAAEKLLERHGIRISVESIRNFMIEAGLWQTRSNKRKRPYQPRYRRNCYGELIQLDGSDHEWFEKRAPRCTLLVYVDDATSALMTAKFVVSESTFTYFDATKAYVLKYGKPVSFYSDKHGVFRVNAKNPKGGEGITQFGRALQDLNIEGICAHSCQAKGRVERANQTLQDRLVKEMRLEGISSMDEGNTFLPQFIEGYNKRFAKDPLSDVDVHRPLQMHEKESIEEIFCWQEDRTLTNNLTLQYDKVKYLIDDTPQTRPLAQKRVTVYDDYDGNINIRYKNQELPYRKFDTLRRINAGAIIENDRLGHMLDQIKKLQDKRGQEQRSKSCPRRKHLEVLSA